MQVLVAIVVAVLMNGGILLVLRRRYDAELYRVVALVFLGTVALRYALALYLWLNHTDLGFSITFWGDSSTYDGFGASLAESWRHGDSAQAWATTIEGKVNRGFIYFVACIYYVFGRNVLLVQFINGIIGALTSVAVLEIGLLVYDRKVATTAMCLTAFFPQMIFWSSALYKDPAVMLCIGVNILSVFHLRRRITPQWVIFYVVSAAALVWLRFYIFYAVAAAAASGLLVGHRRGVVFGLVSQLTIVAGIILLLLYTPVGREVLSQSRFFDLQTLELSRADLSNRAASGFGSGADVSSFAGIIGFLPVGITYLLFAPFPWTVSSLRQALALPDILLWYALTPALVRGLAAAVVNLRRTMPIVVFTSALTIAYGAFLGNVGTAYRQRTQIMMFYFLFIADGLHRRKRVEASLRDDDRRRGEGPEPRLEPETETEPDPDPKADGKPQFGLAAR